MAITPTELTTAMAEHGKSAGLKDVSVYHLHTEGVCPYVTEDCAGIFKTKSFFVGSNLRKATSEGRADYIPVFLSETPLMFRNGQIALIVYFTIYMLIVLQCVINDRCNSTGSCISASFSTRQTRLLLFRYQH